MIWLVSVLKNGDITQFKKNEKNYNSILRLMNENP